MQELDVQAEQAAVVVEADADVVALAALVGGGDEVLAAVLGPLDLAAQADRGPGDQDLLGPGWTILTPKPPPTSGAITSTRSTGTPSLTARANRTEVEVWVEE